MVAGASIAIAFLLFILLLLIGLVVGLVLWLTAKPGTTTNGMACGRCGYSARGLSELSCPECGADLREAGIKPQGSMGARRLGIVLTSVCGVLLCLGCLLSTVFFLSASPTSASGPAPHPSATHSVPAPPAPVQTTPVDPTPINPEDSETDSQQSPDPD